MKLYPKSDDTVAVGVALAIIGLYVAMILGWILNIVKLVGMMSSDPTVTALFVLRVVGVFAMPLGGVLGWVG